MSHLLDFMLKSEPADMDTPCSIFPDDISDMDIPLNFDHSELMTSDFFDSVLSMEKQNLDASREYVSSIDEAHYDYNSNEQSALSPDQKEISSDNGSLDSDDFNLIKGNITLFGNDNSETLKSDDLLTLFEQSQPDLNGLLAVTNPANVVIRQPNTPKKVIVTKPITASNGKKVFQNGKKQVIRVQSLSGNGRPLLLPVNMKNMKKFKIINANDLKVENIKVLPSSCQVVKKVEKYAASTSSESVDDIDVDIENIGNERSYPPLELTAEEKRLLLKEGIKLPSHYPLTKHEEKELKRIRRKIRNKISAQDSRKRKKEYVDQLEEKARKTDEENETLRKRVRMLNRENTKLYEQLKKLQELLFSSSSKATPTTCLMIVLFSTLLVCLPNMRSAENKDLKVSEQQLVNARRALLFQQTKDEEDSNLDEFLVFKDEVEARFEVEEEKENGTNAFAKFMGELSKKYETLIKSNCTDVLQGGTLQEFCRKHEDEIKVALQNLRSFMDHGGGGGGGIEEKKFIEPDISDDEEEPPAFKRRNAYLLDDDDPPTKKIRTSSDNIEYEKSAPVLHETVIDIPTIVDAKTLPVKKE